MPLQATSGAASYDAFGGGAPAVAPSYIEDVFSTYLYTGTGSSQTITNGLDLSTNGGLVWIKSRSAATDHRWTDTVRGATKSLASNLTDAEITESTGLTAFGTTGFTIGADADYNTNAATYASWSFEQQDKFFKVITWTGDGTGTRTITHNLQGTVGCVIAKQINGTGVWIVQHRALTNAWTAARLFLNTTGTVSAFSNFTNPTNTTIDIDSNLNGSGAQWVAYFFAHDAGGFGDLGTDNVISCGSYTGNGSATGPTVSLGYEPQWLLIKQSSTSGNDWNLIDNMRGFTVGGTDAELNPNLSDAESTGTFVTPNATGFQLNTTNAGYNASSATYIYIAIRRGPMKVPTSGTSVYQAVTRTGNSPTVTSITSVGFPPDAVWQKRRSPDGAGSNFFDRLRGRNFLSSATTSVETAANTSSTRDLVSFDMTGFTVGEQWSSELNANTKPEVYWAIKRAPSFFDEVCYTGTGSVLSLTHNLTVAPEFILIKSRSDSSYWIIGANFGASTYAYKNDWGYNNSSNTQSYSSTVGFNAQPTSTTISLSNNSALNVSASTYVMYMWATCAGVSKVGTYTGTGALQTINCGFTSGARFVLITRIGVVGDVNTYIYDSARGISSGNDPYLLLEATSVEVTGTNYVDTTSTGFQVTAAAPAGLNASGGTYIFLAIA